MNTRTYPRHARLRAAAGGQALVHARPGGSSSTATRPSSSRPARTCPSTASRSTRPSTSRTSIVAQAAPVDPPARPGGLRRRPTTSSTSRRGRCATSSAPGRSWRRRRTRCEADDGYRFIFHTPKYRHGAHTTPIDTDLIAMLFGPFGDMYRHDKRTPWSARATSTSTPPTRRSSGIEDGDYVWIDADPADRPFRGWQKDDPDYEFARLLLPRALLPGHAARRHAHVVQHVRRDAGLGARRRRRAPTGSPRTRRRTTRRCSAPARTSRATRALAQADLDDRLAGAQGLLRPRHRQGLPGRRALPVRARRARRS